MALRSDMDISRDAAQRMIEAVLASSDALNKALFDVKQVAPESVFLAYREVVSKVMMTMLTDVLNPLIAKHPDLKPEGFK